MKLAVISDVHANLEALQAVLRHLEAEAPDKIVFLGDAVGYGPEPSECLSLIRETCSVVLMGNHDAASVGLTDIASFNAYARRGVLFAASVLSEDHRGYLAGLPCAARWSDHTLVHSSPHEPNRWHYVMSDLEARMAFEHFEGPACFIGHSHYPLIITQDGEGRILGQSFTDTTLEEGRRYILNVGSVGQPRDGDPRAALVILDEEAGRVRIVRVPYDVTAVQVKMSRCGLPEFLIRRLAAGK